MQESWVGKSYRNSKDYSNIAKVNYQANKMENIKNGVITKQQHTA